MKFIICSALLFALAAALSQEDMDYNKGLMKDLFEAMRDETTSPAEKKTKINYVLDNLKGDYKAKYEKLLAEFKEAVEKIPRESAKAIAKKMIEAVENGDVTEFNNLLHGLDNEDRSAVEGVMHSFHDRIMADFGDLDPHKEQ